MMEFNSILMMSDVEDHMGQLGPVWVGMSDEEDSDVTTFMDECEKRFIKTFGEPE